MNRTEIESAICERSIMNRELVTDFMENFINIVTEALKADEPVKISGFGSFKTRHTAARQAKNPRTGEVVDVEAKISVSFKQSKKLSSALNS